MAELTALGDPIGNLYPVRIPSLGSVADIREALELFYYGNNTSGPTLIAGQEADIPSESIAGRLRTLYNTKMDKTNATALGTFSLDNSTNTPALTFKGTTYNIVLNATPGGSSKTISLPNVSGTIALTTETSMGSLINVDNLTTTHTLNLGYGNVAAGNTKTVTIGGGAGTGNTTVNVGPATGGTRTINLNGTTNASSISATSISLSSTVSATTSVTSPVFVVGTGGPTIKAGTAAPGTEPNGSIYMKTDGDAANMMYYRVAGAWQKMRSGRIFAGTGAPGALGEQLGDIYIDRRTGDVWTAS